MTEIRIAFLERPAEAIVVITGPDGEDEMVFDGQDAAMVHLWAEDLREKIASLVRYSTVS